MRRKKIRELSKKIQGIHVFFCSFSTYIKHFPSGFMRLHFICFKVGIFITVTFITFQNYHCGDYLHIISWNSIA